MITVFTSNQPRHLALINQLSTVDKVKAIVEVPSKQVHIKSKVEMTDTLKRYFELVKQAEKYFFPDTTIINAEVIPIPMFTVNDLDVHLIDKDSHVIVFGASWIKGKLFERIKDNALNLHAGISPEYKGASCNFWALYDNSPDLVGVTVQKLSEELDSGQPLFYSYPDKSFIDPKKPTLDMMLKYNLAEPKPDPFRFTMSAIANCFNDLCDFFQTGKKPKQQHEPDSNVRRECLKQYFTEEIAHKFLKDFDLL